MPEQQPKPINFSENTFEFFGPSCKCEVGTTFTQEREERYTFHLYPIDETIYYAYKAEKGLISSKHKSTRKGMEVFPSLLAIKDSNPKSVKAFIENHGFFFPLNSSKHIEIEAEPFLVLVNRLRATVFLMEAIVEANTDYNKILALTLFLLLEPQTNVELSNEDGTFSTYISEIGHYWHNINEIKERELLHDVEGYNVNEE